MDDPNIHAYGDHYQETREGILRDLSELLPCPFCGNAKNLAMVNEKHDHSGGYFIACPECGASTIMRYAMGDDPKPLLIEAWNRRAAAQAAQPEAVAWLYKTHAGDAQVFTNEPPPRLKELCQPLYATPPSAATPEPSDAERPMKSLNALIAYQLRPFLKPGDKVIWREAFRWHDDNGVMPNHYDGMSVAGLADEFGYQFDWDFNMNHAAIVRATKGGKL